MNRAGPAEAQWGCLMMEVQSAPAGRLSDLSCQEAAGPESWHGILGVSLPVRSITAREKSEVGIVEAYPHEKEAGKRGSREK